MDCVYRLQSLRQLLTSNIPSYCISYETPSKPNAQKNWRKLDWLIRTLFQPTSPWSQWQLHVTVVSNWFVTLHILLSWLSSVQIWKKQTKKNICLWNTNAVVMTSYLLQMTDWMNQSFGSVGYNFPRKKKQKKQRIY